MSVLTEFSRPFILLETLALKQCWRDDALTHPIFPDQWKGSGIAIGYHLRSHLAHRHTHPASYSHRVVKIFYPNWSKPTKTWKLSKEKVSKWFIISVFFPFLWQPSISHPAYYSRYIDGDYSSPVSPSIVKTQRRLEAEREDFSNDKNRDSFAITSKLSNKFLVSLVLPLRIAIKNR